MTRPPLHSIGQIVAMLTARADQLARDLLPGGRRQGREWVAGDLSGAAGRGVSVCIGGAKQGVWADFKSGGGAGDLLDLIAACKTGGDKSEALKFARQWLGIGGEGAREVAPPPPRPRVDYSVELERKLKRAAAIFGKALAWPGTPVETYLAGRAIPLSGLKHVPHALRYAPELFCSERQRPAPAMLACIMRGPEMIGLHQTYLERNPGGWGKAAIANAKKFMGETKGGYIPLSRGVSGLPLARAPAGDLIAITEGIEDGLSVAIEMPEWRVIAACSSGNMQAIDLPAAIAVVVLCLQRDGENRPVGQAIDAAVARFTAEGRTVREARPPEGIKDWNDWRRELASQRQQRNAG